jgi:ribosomal protein S18 acetylase RimI-like enzyme
MNLSFVERPVLNAGEVSALRKAVGWDERESQLAEILGKTYYWAACFDGERLVGSVDVVSDGVDDAYIRNLIVHPAYQRCGIGLKLLEMVTSQTKKDGIKTTNVLFDPALALFYRKAGFKIVGGGLIESDGVRPSLDT